MYQYRNELLLAYLIIGTSLMSWVMPVSWQQQSLVIRNWLSIVWVLHWVNFNYLGGGLSYLFCIRPRQLVGIPGIWLSTFLHADFEHLISNTFPFILLSWLVMLRGLPAFYSITILVILVNGMGTWLVGRPGMHVGASGLNFGYLGYLVAQDNLGLSFLSIGLAFVITLFEGACFWVDLPGFGLRYISWEGHSFGFLGGVLAGTYPILWLKLQAWYF